MPETRGIPEDQTPVERIEPVVRNVLAGSPQGSIRRIVLYLVAIVSIVLSSVDGGFGLIFTLVAVVAALLLALTDQLL